jgi:hypothetical protein
MIVAVTLTEALTAAAPAINAATKAAAAVSADRSAKAAERSARAADELVQIERGRRSDEEEDRRGGQVRNVSIDFSADTSERSISGRMNSVILRARLHNGSTAPIDRCAMLFTVAGVEYAETPLGVVPAGAYSRRLQFIHRPEDGSYFTEADLNAWARIVDGNGQAWAVDYRDSVRIALAPDQEWGAVLEGR